MKRTHLHTLTVLLTLAVCGIGVAGYFWGDRKRAEAEKYAQVRKEMRQIEQALEAYHAATGSYPTGKKGYLRLDRGNRRPFPAVDPWGRDYVYRSPGVVAPDYDLISLGPDGVESMDDTHN